MVSLTSLFCMVGKATAPHVSLSRLLVRLVLGMLSTVLIYFVRVWQCRWRRSERGRHTLEQHGVGGDGDGGGAHRQRADGRAERDAQRVEDPGRDRDGNDVVDGGPEEI